jgi:hypothetical protein
MRRRASRCATSSDLIFIEAFRWDAACSPGSYKTASGRLNSIVDEGAEHLDGSSLTQRQLRGNGRMPQRLSGTIGASRL